MARIAVTGHRDLTGETARAVRSAVRTAISARRGALVGLSCLAEGSDQLFAREVIRAGGELLAVIPARDYRARLPRDARADYDDLVHRAAQVHRMPFRNADPMSFMAAAEFMLRTADELIAVWDGLPARGFGGTADVVGAARTRNIAVRVIWPAGAQRGGEFVSRP